MTKHIDKSLIDRITGTSTLNYSNVIFDQIKSIAFIHDNQEFFSLNTHEKQFIEIFMKAFMINSFDDFSNPEHQWRLNLFKNDISDYNAKNILFAQYKNNEDGLKLFKNILTFQVALLGVLNLRPSFRFKPENVINSYSTFAELWKNNKAVKRDVTNIKSIDNTSFIQKLLSKITSLNKNNHETNTAYLDSLHKLNFLMSKQNNSSLGVTLISDRQLIQNNLSENMTRLFYETDQYISLYNKYVKKHLDHTTIDMFSNFVKDIDVGNPCLQNLFFTITALNVNSSNIDTLKFFLNDYFLSDVSPNRTLKDVFLTDFYEDLYFSYDKKEGLPIPFSYAIKSLHQIEIDENFIENHKKLMCFLLVNQSSKKGLSPFDPNILFEQLQRKEALLSQLSTKPNEKAHKRAKV